MTDKVYEQLKERYKCPIWRDRESNYIPITLLSDSYLLNIIRYLQRHQETYNNALGLFYGGGGPTPGSMAEYYLEHELDEMGEQAAIVSGWLSYFKDYVTKERSHLIFPGDKNAPYDWHLSSIIASIGKVITGK